ncbi:AlpA family transcriptional regulator [Bradyrhizobium sp. 24]|uniref:AlpA family phage regulatory protein n=1 Tax=unclassified Bradyrhizobium TaxID=2631580 RepID=UPI001FF81697|nr:MULTISPECIES: AlpA family transcriptional regulator [unclassified Bradyrhizobium]MCK1299729.1 AlpA family transcriptional regulator [Bradyrhizobium sp. 37]MCK1378092.1 AlpA family transcriptional regulator [Bradyrhizobium sp. 24]MCK1771563.1 AlpA family transcriptional regulator [Bradyrhizobium sp. 134]
MSSRFLRLKAVSETAALPPSSIYEKMMKGEFPKPVPLGRKAVAWLESEIEEWKAARVAERDGAQVAAKMSKRVAGVSSR